MNYNRRPTSRIVQPATSGGVCGVHRSLNHHPEFVFPSLVAGARAHRSANMKAFLLSLVVIWGSLATPSTAEDHPSTIRIDHDPKTIAEFTKIVRDATANGAVRVRFPSGEWNWHCITQVKLDKQEQTTEWGSIDGTLNQDELDKWLAANNVAVVQISMSKDCDPVTYFVIEAFLRERKIAYWVLDSDIDANNKRIRLLKIDGTTRCIHNDAGDTNE